ncbi:MAG: DegT/DnrJ/EryC1/StrS family aminotransferase [Proteobacteria bacterium]|nr:DegT/DnrJ/EryC1/StrS family aminotransferase [Pseudomonadota bacterium]
MTEVKVPFIDLKQRYLEEREELLACVDRVLAKGHLVLTQEVAEFEEKVQAFVGIKHCVGLNSGTDALMIGLWAMGIGKGDEVITPALSFVASTASIAHIGATPVYADVREDLNVDPADIERRITPRTKAIMPVHWTGRIAEMDAIMDIARRHNLQVIEDAAQTMGAYSKGKHGGTWGRVAAISAHPLKNLNAIGDGGMLLTNDDEIAQKSHLYRSHGLRSRDDCVMYGVNSRLDSVNAEVLKFRLDRLKGIVDRRRKNVDLYRKYVKQGPIRLPDEAPGEHGSYVMFISQADGRDELKAYLAERGVETLVYYGKALHLHEAAQRYGYKRGDMPVAERCADRVLALPHHQHLTEAQIAYASEQINKFYGN